MVVLTDSIFSTPVLLFGIVLQVIVIPWQPCRKDSSNKKYEDDVNDAGKIDFAVIQNDILSHIL